jgi:hypothetical protein
MDGPLLCLYEVIRVHKSNRETKNSCDIRGFSRGIASQPAANEQLEYWKVSLRSSGRR